jgi:ERF superfamily
MLTSDTSAAIAPSWVAALNELKDVTREHTANTGTYSYRYADLATAAQQARATLAGHGLAVHQEAHGDNLGSVNVTTRVWHTSGEWVESLPLTMPAKGGPQDVGSAISYARRYALMAFLGLATDDDDGASAQKAAKEADAPHPLSGRVVALSAEMKRLTNTDQDALKAWADGRKLSGAALLADERWLELVESWIDERKATT